MNFKQLKETRDQLKAKGYGSSAPHTQKKSGTSTTVSQTEVAQLDSLKQELAKKRSDLSLLQERIKKLRNTNQDLQKVGILTSFEFLHYILLCYL